MTQQISCGDVVPGCDWKAEAATEEELISKVVEHAAEAHGVDEVSPELAEKVKQAIKTR